LQFELVVPVVVHPDHISLTDITPALAKVACTPLLNSVFHVDMRVPDTEYTLSLPLNPIATGNPVISSPE
jgi:hypothetical protein